MKRLQNEMKKNWVLWVMLIPTFAFFFVNCYMPMFGIYYAFIKPEFGKGIFAGKFVGLDNFKFLFQTDTAWVITRNTILYNLVFIFVGNLLQVLFAVLISMMVGKWFKKAVQSVMLLPYFVSEVVVGTLSYNFFNYDYGILNTWLKSFGRAPQDLYNNPNVFPFVIIFFGLWKSLGYGTIIYLSSILGIDTELYEASNLDGANIFQQIRYITLPLLKPTFIIMLLYSLGNIMKGQFGLFYQLVGMNGQLFSTTDIIDTYVYRALMQGTNFGMSTAAGVYQSVFGFVLILITNTLVKRYHPDYALF